MDSLLTTKGVVIALTSEMVKKPLVKKSLPAWMEKMERQHGLMSLNELASF